MRVYELAKELGLSNKDLIARLKEMGIEVKSHSSSLSGEQADRARSRLPPAAPPPPPPATLPPPEPVAEKEEAPSPPASQDLLIVKFPITVREFAEQLGQKPNVVIKKLMDIGFFCSLNQFLDESTAGVVARDYGFELQSHVHSRVAVEAPPVRLEAPPEKTEAEKLRPRAPVVTLMGHIDHGKTSLLDAIRRSRITAGEAGGITQHIGAYRVDTKHGSVVFLDTPGHKAFTTMRARGAQLTDIVVLVVAADDGIMPQTLEAIDHARSAHVPIVVAINKIDKSTASLDKVKRQLAEHDLLPEDMGGKTICVPVSAKTKEGLDHLLEMILLQAEIMELKANPLGPAEAVVVESRHTADRGPVVTLLVKKGTLKRGDSVVCDVFAGKIKGMFDDRGAEVKTARPSTPVEVLGIIGVPAAGSICRGVPSDTEAREASVILQSEKKERSREAVKRATLEDFFQKLAQGKTRELRLILKADVQGTLEALTGSLAELTSSQAELKFVHTGVGAITESDVMLAAAAGAVIVGFHVGADSRIRQLATAEGVDVHEYTIIYEAVDEVKKALEGLLEPKLEELMIGRAIVKQTFKISRLGTVAGCEVEKGKIMRGSRVKVWRGDQIVFRDTIISLKRFKDSVDEVSAGMECGISLANFHDFEAGDVFESYRVKETVQKL